MNILVVEDDLFKFSKIESVVLESPSNWICERIDNVHDAIEHLKYNNPNKLILDMSLPSHAAKAGEGSPISMPTGGIEIILEMRSGGKTDIDILILTQYPDVEIEFEYYSISDSEQIIKNIYGMKKLRVAHYDDDSKDWVRVLELFLET